MALIQHYNEKVRFQQQVDNARADVLPFIEESFQITPSCRILDIGCGDGGVLLPFLERGCNATGIELEQQKADFAKGFLNEYILKGQVEIINQNIYEESTLQEYMGQFDLIILKDVIEHIPYQERFIPYLKKFLKPGGRVFFGFPPWYMPHGGHQQICENKLLAFLPYIHLFPNFLYFALLKLLGESKGLIEELKSVKSTGISIERFERIVKKSKYSIELNRHFLLNPIYRFKFGVKPRVQFKVIKSIPFFRNFLTTCVYYLIKKEN
jgi:SAM-dependent methyltransferase